MSLKSLSDPLDLRLLYSTPPLGGFNIIMKREKILCQNVIVHVISFLFVVFKSYWSISRVGKIIGVLEYSESYLLLIISYFASSLFKDFLGPNTLLGIMNNLKKTCSKSI